MPLNDTLIRNAKPKSKPYKLPREQGLYLIVNANGGKHWRYSYLFNGKEKLLSFGSYPAVPLKLARERRDDAARLLAQGVDPSADRVAQRARQVIESANTFKVNALEWLHLKEGALSEDTLKKARWMLDYAFPKLGDLPLTSIQPPDVLGVLRDIEASGKLETMHRVKARISEVFRFAIALGRVTSDPCRDLRGALKAKRPVEHLAALTDPKEVGGLMRAINGYTGTPEVCAALKLAPLLFVRPGELRTAQWDQFDLDSELPSWRYHVTKTKVDHIVSLPKQAVAILRELEPLTNHGLGLKPGAPRYVFPGARSRLRPMSENTITAALRSLGYSGDQMTGHGFRATARTLLAEEGWMPDIIERQLAHKASGPLGAAYDRAMFLQDRRKMMQSWADYLERLAKGSKVVAIERVAA